MTTLESLLNAVPGDPQAAFVLADYLEEQNDPRGELLRLVWTATRTVDLSDRETIANRMRELLRLGVEPIGPHLRMPLRPRTFLTFAWIPPGRFLMGSPPAEALATAQACNDFSSHTQDATYCIEEQPQHPVTLTSGFWMGIYPLTQSQWKSLGTNNPSRLQRARHPVEQLAWSNAADACQRLSEIATEREWSYSFRLPTEAEWEYACRAGTLSAYFWGDTLPKELARFSEVWSYSHQQTVEVASYPANAFGLHDMHGNVWEWCSDWFGQTYYRDSPAESPRGPDTGAHHVLRGGSASVLAHECRSAIRGEAWNDRPSATAARFAAIGDFGVRVVCEAKG